MPDTVFKEAYARVRASYSDDAWFRHTPREITNAIYAEIRAIDRERLARAANDSRAAVAIAAE
jgi:hypothetical protein